MRQLYVHSSSFVGNVEENDLGAGGDKALFVTAGGTLEIHGKPKLSWTKLTQTAPKYDVDTDAVVSMMVRLKSTPKYNLLHIEYAFCEFYHQIFYRNLHHYRIQKPKTPRINCQFVRLSLL